MQDRNDLFINKGITNIMTYRYGLEDLKQLMVRLRDPDDGCPWDIKQNYRSVVPHTLEEVYEVIDTIEREDFGHLSEELGDLLFQIVFYAQLAKEDKRFDLDEVIDQQVRKLLSRHPHVFPDGTLESRSDGQTINSDEVNVQWETIKAGEKQKNGQAKHLLDDIPQALPAMLRAKKLQSRAAKVGFDWKEVQTIFFKVHEELNELQEAIESGNVDDMESELGDVLFVLANIARHTNIDPEQAVRKTNAKFERRFGHIEARVNASGKDWRDFSLQELDNYWNEAKQLKK